MTNAPRPDNWLDEPNWVELLPDPVDQLSAAEDWKEIVAELRAQSKLATVNNHAVSRLVVARVIYEQMARLVMKEGAVVLAPKTKVPMQNPALSIMNGQQAICERLESELTLSPRKRATGGKVSGGKRKGAGGVDL